ncbi:hypothetical protein IB223_00020 [Pseudoxanthomonas sp. PXM03]|uniref:hypothetical protein n=1 Tax=Pseudoxanthomonas sp. PXM03 TaxID=2769284 RepID=UPI001782119E|nr:hypothetical protein [Pseudoxanthomonas sp. PXM03]MBD9434470.1 hypothetical protein [Pseudoxanthomonas sp. PXM03]
MTNISAAEELDSCAYLLLAGIGEPEENSLRLVLDEALVLEREESLEVNGVSLTGIRPIEVTHGSRRFEVLWGTYITYAVHNESYCHQDDTEVWAGERLRVYSRSKFLEFTAAATFASDGYPGPFKHYRLICGNHVIDVASEHAPVVTRLARNNSSGSKSLRGSAQFGRQRARNFPCDH